MSTAKPLVITCPTCKKKSKWSTSNKYRPFCSEKCRLIDMGEWFLERKMIPGEDFEPSDD